MKTFVTKPCMCPFCGYVQDRATGDDAATRPEPGDASICIECGEVGIFSVTGTIEKPTADAQQALDADPRLARMRTIWSTGIRPLVEDAGKPVVGRT